MSLLFFESSLFISSALDSSFAGIRRTHCAILFAVSHARHKKTAEITGYAIPVHSDGYPSLLFFALEKGRNYPVSFRFVSFRFVSFRFVSFRFVSFRFVSFRASVAPFHMAVKSPSQHFPITPYEWPFANDHPILFPSMPLFSHFTK